MFLIIKLIDLGLLHGRIGFNPLLLGGLGLRRNMVFCFLMLHSLVGIFGKEGASFCLLKLSFILPSFFLQFQILLMCFVMLLLLILFPFLISPQWMSRLHIGLPPSAPLLKVNVDASWSASKRHGFVGIVIQDSMGQFMAAAMYAVQATSVASAEALALLCGCELAVVLGYHWVIIEFDSKDSISTLSTSLENGSFLPYRLLSGLGSLFRNVAGLGFQDQPIWQRILWRHDATRGCAISFGLTNLHLRWFMC